MGNAIEFDGKSAYVKTKPHANPTKAITVSAWVKSAEKSWNAHGVIMSKRDAYIIHNNSGGVGVSFPICNGGCWNKPGEWRILVDGKVESKLKLQKSPIAAEEAKELWIGRDQCCDPRYGMITVDEAMVFDVALGEADLKPIYELGIDGALAVDSLGKLTVSWARIRTE